MNDLSISSSNEAVVNKMRIPVYKPLLTGKEKEYVNQCLDSTWISSKGEFISRFEKEFANYLNVKHATTVSNGTVALHLALHALGIGHDDEVIVPTFTYIASVNTISYVGATPVFVDSKIDSWNMDPKQIEEKITSKTKAVMAVHLYGNPCAMEQILDICKKNNLLLIEDAAEAFGSKYNGNYAGSFGDVSTFSFFGNKTITTGEGGMVVAKDQSIFNRMTKLKTQSVSSNREYWHDEIGFNYRMTNICAAIGLAQIEEADNIIEKKKQIATWYKLGLEKCPVSFQYSELDMVNTYWMVSITAENSELRDGIRVALKNNGVETRPFFYPAHVMPTFKVDDEKFPVAESLGTRGLNLPSYPSLTRDEVLVVCTLIKNYFNEI